MVSLWGLDLHYCETGVYATTLQSAERETLLMQKDRVIPHPETGEPCIAAADPYLIAENESNPTSDWE